MPRRLGGAPDKGRNRRGRPLLLTLGRPRRSLLGLTSVCRIGGEDEFGRSPDDALLTMLLSKRPFSPTSPASGRRA